MTFQSYLPGLVLIGVAMSHKGVKIPQDGLICKSPDNATSYVAKGPSFLAIDAKTGEQKWAFPIKPDWAHSFGPSCQPSYDGSALYVSNSSWAPVLSGGFSQVFALNAETGTQKWVSKGFPGGEAGPGFLPHIFTPSTVWINFETSFGCDGVFAIDSGTGHSKGPINITVGNGCPKMLLSPDKSTIYAGGIWAKPFHNDVTAFGADTLEMKWDFRKPNAFNLEPESQSPDGDKVYLRGYENTVLGTYTVDAASGKQIGDFVPHHDPAAPAREGGLPGSILI